MIKIIAIGKLKDRHLKALCEEYIKRMQPYHKLEVMEVADESIPNAVSDKENQQILQKEGERVLQKIKDMDHVILLDLHGKMMSSEQFANYVDQTQIYQTSNITFVIGGSLGVSQNLIKRANLRLKLSDMTFLHQMTRYILLEQIYRAYKIIKKETYHK